jgi:hypothetical protein
MQHVAQSFAQVDLLWNLGSGTELTQRFVFLYLWIEGQLRLF